MEIILLVFNSARDVVCGCYTFTWVETYKPVEHTKWARSTVAEKCGVKRAFVCGNFNGEPTFTLNSFRDVTFISYHDGYTLNVEIFSKF